MEKTNDIKKFMREFRGFSIDDFSEITYAMVKPDAMCLFDEICQDIERRGFEVLFWQVYQLSRDLAECFYSEHKDKDFYNRLISQMTADPAGILILEKKGTVPCFQVWRGTIGSTNPEFATEGTLRHFYSQKLFGGAEAYKKGEATNCFHGADSVASVIRESNLVLYDIAMSM